MTTARMPLIGILCFLGCTVFCGCGSDDAPIVAPQAEAIDLGLSVAWADRNLGAAHVGDPGRLYGWADSAGLHRPLDEDITIQYTGINGFSCQWHSAYFGGMNPPANIASTAYDAARYAWSNNWRLPTDAEMRELLDRCSWQLIGTGKSRAYLVTGPNGNSITIPLAGNLTTSVVDERGSAGYYWTASLVNINRHAEYDIQSNTACAAWALVITAADVPVADDIRPQPRNYSLSIRPVMSK